MKSRTTAILSALVVVSTITFALIDRGVLTSDGHGRAVDALIARNVEARGGADAWRAVSSLRLEGQMDLGQGMHVPYTMEQQRPGRMCLEFEFDEQVATQCVADGSGWKTLPYRGRYLPEAMTPDELRDVADAASIDGLLFNSAERGTSIEIVGKEVLDGRDVVKLEVVLSAGGKRWVYLDAETALEVRVDALRILRGEEHLVETWYHDWREQDGLLIARRQITRTEGMQESNVLTVDDVSVNANINSERFRNPLVANSAGAANGSNSS